MKCFRPTSAGIVILASLFLLGFKNPNVKTTSPAKKSYTAAQQKNQKPLDLTLPVNNNDLEEQHEILAIMQSKATNANVSSNQGPSRPIELQGRLIMSQEQEAEKSRSADGAGIVINLRH